MSDITNQQLLDAITTQLATKDDLKQFATKADLDVRFGKFETKLDHKLDARFKNFKEQIVDEVNDLIKPIIDTLDTVMVTQDKMQQTLDGIVEVASLGRLAHVTTENHEVRITRLELQARQG